MEQQIKKLKIIPDDIEKYKKNIESLSLEEPIKQFLINCLTTVIDSVDEVDDFYIDYPYKYNFYNYSKKQDTKFMIKAFKQGYKEKELNFFNYESNFLNKDGSKYMKLKNKIGYDEYYDYVCDKIPSYKHDDDNLIIDRIITSNLNELVFDKDIQEKFIIFIKELFNKGLWLNNFNNYSIRYKNEFYVYDPDTFYVISHNEDLIGTTSNKDFLKKYTKYKLRPKSIIYRLKDDLDVEAAKYIYYSYWFLENISRRITEYEN